MKIFNDKILYIYKFIGQCLPIYAFYTILFLERGKTVSDIAVLIALWSVFTIVFEIPAGILADRWNRRNILAMAAVLQGICFVIWFFSHTFIMFALGFFFWAIAGAFTSGTEEGLIYDNLKSDGREDSFTKIYGKAQFYATIGALVGIVSAGIIAVFISVEAIALISAVICFTNGIFALQIRERNFYSAQLGKESIGFFETFKKAIFFIKRSGFALVVILFLVFFASIGSYLDEFDAFIADDWNISELWVSGILVIRFAFVALGDMLAPIVEKKISSVRQIFLLNGLACITLITFAAIWNWYAILFFGISCMFMAITQILLVNALQNEIKEEGRATVMSFYSVGQNIVMICLSLIFALLAGIFHLQQVYIIISIYGIIGCSIFYVLFFKIRLKKI
ncbi:MAG: MFS transporter [Defluviitaleaceae bacterium]|nr:MFS transporter [Defluviitaleaceae bacterium]